MRIGIDISAMIGLQGGMRIYLEQLVKHLARLDQKNEYFLYAAFWRDFEEKKKILARSTPRNLTPCLKRFPYQLLLFLENRLEVRIEERWLLPELDVFHGACQIVPPLSHTHSVMTVHHFEDPRYSSLSTWWQRFFYREVYEKSARRADRLIADSLYTKRFLMEDLGIPENKIVVIYHGIFDPKPTITEEEKAAHRKAFHLPNKFIVCVSHLYPRKNTVRLVQAFHQLSQHWPDINLVLVGQGEPEYLKEVLKTIHELGLENRVLLTGPVPHEKVPLFYALASLFVLPSLLEGFGIPLIEAMAMGCPVVAADSTSIPEVVGEAGLLFNPLNVEEMASKMSKVLEDSDLRKSLVQKGLARAAQFSWEKAARETLSVYQAVISS